METTRAYKFRIYPDAKRQKETLGQRERDAQGDSGQYISTGNASRVEELRTDKTHPLQDAVIA